MRACKITQITMMRSQYYFNWNLCCLSVCSYSCETREYHHLIFITTSPLQSVTASQSFVLRYASRQSLVPYGTLVIESSSCMRAKRFATSVSFCSFATVYSSFTRSHSLVRSITVFDSPNPDSLVSIILVILNFHRKVVIELDIVVANKRIRLFDVWCVQLVSRSPFHKEKRPLHRGSPLFKSRR